jgi:hypothetical protein
MTSKIRVSEIMLGELGVAIPSENMYIFHDILLLSDRANICYNHMGIATFYSG